jgi:beta-lactamase regulating signal transducer with metallopeptidase domain
MLFHRILAEWSQWLWPPLANHLWQTTLFVLMVWGAARLLRGMTARVRYFIWLIALVKFLLPSVLLTLACSRIGLDLALTSPAAHTGVDMIYQIAQPILPNIDQGTVPAAERVANASLLSAEKHHELYCLLSLVWVAGFAIISARWLIRRWRLMLVLRSGVEISSGREAVVFNRALSWLLPHREIKLVAVPGLQDMGVWRIWRPIVLLPDGMAEKLSDPELEAVMMHELVHVIRSDNLKDTWRMLLCSLLWFHPLIWLIDRELLAEREVICDEAVVRYCGDAKAYAAGLWKVAQYGFGWHFAGISRAAGSTLLRRIKLMLDTEDRTKLFYFDRVMAGFAICGLVIFAVAIAVFTRSDVNAAKPRILVLSKQPLPEIRLDPDKRSAVLAPGHSDSKHRMQGPAAETTAARPQTKSHPDERPRRIMPVQFNNDPQIPILITEAQVEVGEPFDVTEVFNPFSSPPRMMRDLKFTLKLVNQGDQPLSGLRLAVQSPLFFQSGLGFEGKNSSLGVNEQAIVTWTSSVDDQEYTLDFIANMMLKPVKAIPDSVKSPDQWPYSVFGANRLKRAMLLVDVAFYDVKRGMAGLR